MNVSPEVLLEMIGGLYVENRLLQETLRQLQAQNAEQKKHIAELEKPEEKSA